MIVLCLGSLMGMDQPDHLDWALKSLGRVAHGCGLISWAACHHLGL
jgi:hypothetical protein